MEAVGGKVPVERLALDAVGRDEQRGRKPLGAKDRQRRLEIVAITVVESDQRRKAGQPCLPGTPADKIGERDDVEPPPQEFRLLGERGGRGADVGGQAVAGSGDRVADTVVGQHGQPVGPGAVRGGQHTGSVEQPADGLQLHRGRCADGGGGEGHEKRPGLDSVPVRRWGSEMKARTGISFVTLQIVTEPTRIRWQTARARLVPVARHGTYAIVAAAHSASQRLPPGVPRRP